MKTLFKKVEKAIVNNNKRAIKEIKNMSFNNVDFTYASSSKPTLQDISFEINKGEKVGIIGPTGSGKSTLLQHLNALLKPTKGTVNIGERVITQQTDNKN